MRSLKSPSICAILLAILVITCHSLQCPPGFDAVPPRQPLGICVVIGCAKAVKDQRCATDCVQGFIKTSTLSCEVIKCSSQSKTSCTSCEVGYQLQALPANPILRVCVPTNCQSYDRTTRLCKKCQPGFALSQNKTCSPINCQQPNPQLSQCLKCKDEYILSKFNASLNLCMPQNCTQYSIELNQCLKCELAYSTTEKGTCQIGQKNCNNYNQFSGLCYGCNPGYRLVGFKSCIKESPACLQYEIGGCTSCKIPFRPGKQTCQPNYCDIPNSQNSMKCDRCQAGYKLNSDSLCEVQNCDSFDKQAWRCSNCTSLYTLTSLPSLSNSSYVVQRCLNKLCKVFDKDYLLCSKCNDQFTNVNGVCTFTNCAKSTETSCTECIEGWRKNENGNCITFNCLEYVNPKKCKTCPPGKRLYKGTCIQDNCLFRGTDGNCTQCPAELLIHPEFSQYCVVYFCKKIDQDGGDCLECLPNFKLSSKGTCDSTLCLGYENKTGFVGPQCTNCSDGYEPIDGVCVAAKKYCDSYIFEQGKCEKCASGYQLNFNKTHCQPLRCRNSTQKSTYSVCNKCNLGYRVVSFDNGTQQCVPNNCTTLKQSQCAECANGFSLFIDICLAQNCKEYNELGFCSVCNFGFYLNSTTLTCQRQKCKQESKDKCLKCEDNYYPDDSATQMKGLCRPYGCETIKYTDQSAPSEPPIKCLKCYAGFVPMPNTEMCAASDCNLLDMLTGICRQCRPGFSLTSEGRCTYVRNNQYCPDRKYPNIYYACEAIKAKNCFSANPKNTQECYKCEAGYYLQGKDCRSFAKCLQKFNYLGCTKCEIGYRPNKETGECENSIQKCAEYDPLSGQCQRCDNGYQIILYPNKACKLIPDFCSRVDAWGNCEQCRLPGRVLNADKQCYLPAADCLEYEYIRGLCTRCEKGLYLKPDNDNTACIQNPPNCEIAGGLGDCKKCSSDNFVLNSGICFKSIEKCETYNLQKCTKCVNGYFPDSSQLRCRQVPKYCNKVQAKTDGVCEQCREGFENVKGVCVRPIDFCVSYEQDGTCQRCTQGYSPNQFRTICLLGYV